MNTNDKTTAFWNAFLLESALPAGTNYYESYAFGSGEEMARELLALVLAGKKTATCSSAYYFENHDLPLPKAGDYNIATDWDGTPRCVLKTTAVTVMPFNEMTFEVCKLEGEDDNLQSWQEGHVRFFTWEAAQEGYVFTPEMPIVFEDFEVVYAPEVQSPKAALGANDDALQKALKSFLDGEKRLIKYPSKHRAKMLALAYLASKFAPETRYTEAQVNETLKAWHTFGDWAMLRREMYNLRFFERAANGSEYWLSSPQPDVQEFL